ncbi:MAG TPA: ROK family protein [Pyrinomonadaceae bacterium]|nr:ROK family protein [Pyrinomonadaceae bacterium]
MTPEPQQTGKSIGVEANSKMVRTVVLDGATVVHRAAVPLESESSLIPQLAAIIRNLRQSAPEVTIVGVAVPGLINRETNHVSLSMQFPTLAEIDFAEQLFQETGLRIRLENDANSAAFGEYRLGAGRGSRSLFFATVGHGIGGSIILDGRLWRGARGFAGEFGHIAIDEDGVKLEDVASEANIVRRVKERLYQDSTSSLSRRQLEQATTIHDIVQAAKNGDDFSQMMLERTGKYIGTAIASVINLLNPERVVVGGEVMEAERVIIQSIIRQASQRSFRPSFAATEIVTAELGADAAAIGAALFSVSE